MKESIKENKVLDMETLDKKKDFSSCFRFSKES